MLLVVPGVDPILNGNRWLVELILKSLVQCSSSMESTETTPTLAGAADSTKDEKKTKYDNCHFVFYNYTNFNHRD